MSERGRSLCLNSVQHTELCFYVRDSRFSFFLSPLWLLLLLLFLCVCMQLFCHRSSDVSPGGGSCWGSGW